MLCQNYSLCDNYLRRGVLVAVHTVQRILRSVKGELRGIIATVRDQKLAFIHMLTRKDVITHKKPWPMFTMGWTGEAAAASLTIDLRNPVRTLR